MDRTECDKYKREHGRKVHVVPSSWFQPTQVREETMLVAIIGNGAKEGDDGEAGSRQGGAPNALGRDRRKTSVTVSTHYLQGRAKQEVRTVAIVSEFIRISREVRSSSHGVSHGRWRDSKISSGRTGLTLAAGLLSSIPRYINQHTRTRHARDKQVVQVCA